ncbi:MAG: tryptophan synthase subunit alpha [Euryarchaeota archaeon]|nr:tryptophan synthase subunit alpha [Euryarchaeota archaeon]
MKLSEAFKDRPLLIAYFCAGDPDPQSVPRIVDLLVRAGADVVELGLPHSDPIADGPVIQAASQRAIEAGMNTDLYFEMISKIEADVPLVFMGYYNMIFRRGVERFVQDCASSGITGLIVPDLPMEEARPLKEACTRQDLDLIYLVAPNTPPERIESIVEETSGFVYLVARSGVTGARRDLLDETKDLIDRVKTDVPKAVGFGISTPEQAAEVIRSGADAAIVGSACVDLIARGDLEGLERLVGEMKEAIQRKT